MYTYVSTYDGWMDCMCTCVWMDGLYVYVYVCMYVCVSVMAFDYCIVSVYRLSFWVGTEGERMIVFVSMCMYISSQFTFVPAYIYTYIHTYIHYLQNDHIPFLYFRFTLSRLLIEHGLSSRFLCACICVCVCVCGCMLYVFRVFSVCVKILCV